MKSLKELQGYRYKPKISIEHKPRERNRRTHHLVVKTLRYMVNKPRIYRSYAPINWDAFAPPPDHVVENYYVPRKQKCPTTKTPPPSKLKY